MTYTVGMEVQTPHRGPGVVVVMHGPSSIGVFHYKWAGGHRCDQSPGDFSPELAERFPSSWARRGWWYSPDQIAPLNPIYTLL